MKLTKNLTNEELMSIEDIKNAVNNGNLIVIDKVQTSNPDYVNLYMFGNVEGLMNTTINEAQSMFLNFNSGKIQLRCIQNASTEIANKYEIGNIIDGIGIQVFDSVEKSFETQAPRKDKEGNILLNEGMPIYRTTIVNTKEAIEAEGHKTLKVTGRVNEDGEVDESAKGTNADAVFNKVQV